MPAIFSYYIENVDEVVDVWAYLKRADVTQKKLADDLGVTPMTITKLIRRPGACIVVRDQKAVGTIEARRGPK